MEFVTQRNLEALAQGFWKNDSDLAIHFNQFQLIH